MPPHLNQIHPKPKSGALFLSQLWWLHCDTVHPACHAAPRSHNPRARRLPLLAGALGASSLPSKPREPRRQWPHLVPTLAAEILQRALPKLSVPLPEISHSLPETKHALPLPALPRLAYPEGDGATSKEGTATATSLPSSRTRQFLVRFSKPPNWSPSECAPSLDRSSCKLRLRCWRAVGLDLSVQ